MSELLLVGQRSNAARFGHGKERDQFGIGQQFDELLFQGHGKGLSRDQDPAQAAATAWIAGDFGQHHAADRGHHAHHCDAMGLDQVHSRCRIEAFHDDDAGAQGQGIAQAPHARAVGQRRAHQKAIVA